VIDCWRECDLIAWDADERKQIGFAYIQHLANLQSIELWETPYKLARFKGYVPIDLLNSKTTSEYVNPPF